MHTNGYHSKKESATPAKQSPVIQLSNGPKEDPVADMPIELNLETLKKMNIIRVRFTAELLYNVLFNCVGFSFFLNTLGLCYQTANQDQIND